MTFAPRHASRALTLVAALALSACAGNGIFDDLDQAQPVGGPFSQALFKDYSYLARSFGDVDTSASTAFDAEQSNGDATDSSNLDVSDIANLYAQKALDAAKGNQVAPESPPDGDSDAAAQHDRLLKDIEAGSDKFPEDAARAQVEYDCWVLNNRVASQHDAAQQCRNGLNAALNQLEHEINPAPVVTTTTTTTTTTSANYQVFFDFNSWNLSAEQLTVLQQAIAGARAGQQAHITIVGHTDTSGSAGYNERLSVKRANVVEEALVDMGARREAIQTSGVGETDLAVQTADGVKEPKNRRAVITLIP
jgi:OOP family OmpA-OmpF porin